MSLTSLPPMHQLPLPTEGKVCRNKVKYEEDAERLKEALRVYLDKSGKSLWDAFYDEATSKVPKDDPAKRDFENFRAIGRAADAGEMNVTLDLGEGMQAIIVYKVEKGRKGTPFSENWMLYMKLSLTMGGPKFRKCAYITIEKYSVQLDKTPKTPERLLNGIKIFALRVHLRLKPWTDADRAEHQALLSKQYKEKD